MTEINRYEHNGIVWECRSPLVYMRRDGQPCIQMDMRGPAEGFFDAASSILATADQGDGWTRYWYVSTDEELQACTIAIVEGLERYAALVATRTGGVQ